MFQSLLHVQGFSSEEEVALKEVLSQIPDVVLCTPEFLAKNYKPDYFLTPNSLSMPCTLAGLIALIQKATLPQQILTYGTVSLNVYEHTATIGEKEFDLTDIEAGLLARLLAAKGAAVPRDVLLAGVWGFRPDLETHTLETHIYRLRQKIEPDPACPIYVITDIDSYRIA
jgi:hypothetical protein